MRRKQPPLPAEDFASIKARIEHWRKTRLKRTAMPEELWEEAAALAQKHGVYTISRELQISYDKLKNKAGCETRKVPKASRIDFIELKSAQLANMQQADAPIIELTRTDGIKLTIRLADSMTLDINGLIHSFVDR